MLLKSTLAAIAAQRSGTFVTSTFAQLLAKNYHDIYYEDDDRRFPMRQRVERYRQQNRWFSDLLKNQKQLGASLLGIGLMLTIMGMMLFFEGNLLRLGNVGIISGTFLLIGPGRVSGFFFKESRMQATVITLMGIFMVFWGRPRLGLVIEIFGLLNLFGNMFPMLLAVGKNIPIVGDVLSTFESGRKTNNRSRYDGTDPERRSYNPEF